MCEKCCGNYAGIGFTLDGMFVYIHFINKYLICACMYCATEEYDEEPYCVADDFLVDDDEGIVIFGR